MSVLAAVAFPEAVDHVSMSKVFVEGSIIGAGFFYVDDDNKVITYDESVGLAKGPDPQDVKLLERMLGLNQGL